ncbi:T9SS type A sorting domain-containing protein [candidate division WOR-3 bacterium]|nr:T9SS type A sorting domain-containing protein [candidate division WOR-3 bacterium]
MPLVGRAGKSKKSKDGGSAAYHGGSIFALKGGNTQEFWRRGEGADWFELDTMPSYGSTGRKKRAKAGADIVSFGGGVFFALKGNRTLELWRYAMPEPGRASESGVVSAAGRLETGRGVRAAPSVVTGGRLQLAGDVAAAARASIYDASGRLVLGPRPAGGGTLDVRGLAAGVYLVRMDGAGRTAATRFVVE